MCVYVCTCLNSYFLFFFFLYTFTFLCFNPFFLIIGRWSRYSIIVCSAILLILICPRFCYSLTFNLLSCDTHCFHYDIKSITRMHSIYILSAALVCHPFCLLICPYFGIRSPWCSTYTWEYIVLVWFGFLHLQFFIFFVGMLSANEWSE